MTPQRALELHRQKEIIERWLDTPGIPIDAHQKLLEMLGEVNDEMNAIAAAHTITTMSA